MKSLLISLFVWVPLLGRSQTSVQVVTKVIEKSLPYTDGQLIQLNAQKADVTLKGWGQSTVVVKLRLIAKHPDRAVAEREVAYHQYVLQNENGQIELSNRFIIPQRAGKLQSQLKAVYEINMPAKALMALTNSFGDIRLNALSGTINVTFEFGKLTLTDIRGKLAIQSTYGDIDGRNLDATLIAKTEKADVILQDLSGTVDIQSHYGNLTLLPATSLKILKVDAARSEILVTTRRLSDFRFDVVTSYADINLPETLMPQVSKSGNKRTFTYQPLDRKSEVRIQNSYGNVTIQGEKPLVTN
ncbi:DUF4097 family beta strand repeat-containing protein [Spirosoma validum]|uniref:DUF4097 family beta strand repeat protein n=1 Tax=Spirosoma validum TaxID=2771355 RepID=A0A927B3P3_9BACT|nr:DUF4097 family beta strand repeat-containing protein [Spirosoma validum]MBD2754799.1 DUF4097 family beta strand repeat protein [Spirosoma validum]